MPPREAPLAFSLESVRQPGWQGA